MFSSYKYFPIIYLYLGRIIFVSQKIKKRLNYFSNFIILFPQKKKKKKLHSFIFKFEDKHLIFNLLSVIWLTIINLYSSSHYYEMGNVIIGKYCNENGNWDLIYILVDV